jgi:hypothetical protein
LGEFGWWETVYKYGQEGVYMGHVSSCDAELGDSEEDFLGWIGWNKCPNMFVSYISLYVGPAGMLCFFARYPERIFKTMLYLRFGSNMCTKIRWQSGFKYLLDIGYLMNISKLRTAARAIFRDMLLTLMLKNISQQP